MAVDLFLATNLQRNEREYSGDWPQNESIEGIFLYVSLIPSLVPL